MILVTGGTGLIGSHLLYNLTSNTDEKIKAIKRPHSNTNNVKKIFSYYTNNVDFLFNKIEWQNADILNYYELMNAFEGISKVYNCAGVISYNKSFKKLLYEVNVKGTENIINCCLENNIEKLVHLSSVASLGEPANSDIITEDTKWYPNEKSPMYYKSKFLGELEVWRGINEGLNAVIINPSIVLGPGLWDNKTLGLVLKMIYKGFRLYTDDVTGYVNVRDVVNIMILLMNSNISGERFIVSEGNYSFKEMLEKILKYMDLPDQTIKINDTVLNLTCKIQKLLWILFRVKPVLTSEYLKIAREKCYYSNEKIKNTLNYSFIKIDETIEFLITKYMEDLKLNTIKIHN